MYINQTWFVLFYLWCPKLHILWHLHHPLPLTFFSVFHPFAFIDPGWCIFPPASSGLQHTRTRKRCTCCVTMLCNSACTSAYDCVGVARHPIPTHQYETPSLGLVIDSLPGGGFKAKLAWWERTTTTTTPVHTCTLIESKKGGKTESVRVLCWERREQRNVAIFLDPRFVEYIVGKNGWMVVYFPFASSSSSSPSPNLTNPSVDVPQKTPLGDLLSGYFNLCFLLWYW